MQDQVTGWWSSVSLRTKITGVTVLLVTLGLLVAGVGTMTVLRNYLLDDVVHRIVTTAQAVVSITARGSSTCEQTAGPNNYFFEVLGPDGEFVCSNKKAADDKPHIGDLPLTAVVRMGGTPFTAWDSDHTSQWRLVAMPVTVPQTGEFLTVIVGQSLDDNNNLIGHFLAIFLGFA